MNAQTLQQRKWRFVEDGLGRQHGKDVAMKATIGCLEATVTAIIQIDAAHIRAGDDDLDGLNNWGEWVFDGIPTNAT